MKIKNFLKAIFPFFYKPAMVYETIVQEEPETESERAFSEAIKNNDFDLIISFIQNDYELTSKQKNIFLEKILNTIQKSVVFSERSFDIKKCTPEELIYLTMTFHHDFLDNLLTENLLTPKFSRITEAILSSSSHYYNLDLSYSNNKDSILSKIKSSALQSNNRQIDYHSEKLSADNSEYHARQRLEYIEMGEKIEDLSFITSKVDFKSKKCIFFPSQENFRSIFNERKRFSSNSYEFGFSELKTPINLSELYQYSDYLLTFTRNLFIRTAINEKSVDSFVKKSLESESPIAYAFFVNLSHKNEVFSKYETNYKEIDLIKSVTDKLVKNNSYSDIKRQYENLSAISSVLTKDLMEIDEEIIKSKIAKQQSLNQSVALMKKEKEIKKRSSMTTFEILEDSNLDMTSKGKLKNVLTTSQELLNSLELNLEEKHFCQSVDKNILSLLQLQFAFNNSREEIIEYRNSLNEQVNNIWNTLDNIRTQHKQKAMDIINEQINELVVDNKKTRTITR